MIFNAAIARLIPDIKLQLFYGGSPSDYSGIFTPHVPVFFSLAGEFWRYCAEILHLLQTCTPPINHQISKLWLER